MSTHTVNNPDYIFLGAGCASLSLVMRMIKSGKFSDKQILLIDKAPKTKNDRTWCFWEKENGFFKDIEYKKWESVHFNSNKFSSLLDIYPYEYKMIRGIDFYNYCFEEIKRQNNVHIIYREIKNYSYKDETVTIDSGTEKITAKNAIVFNSIYTPSKKYERSISLMQHFKGWIIETDKPSFTPGIATLMDFRVHQDEGTTFAYMLPFSETNALVEYTLFTGKLLGKQQYDAELKAYINDFLKIDQYKICDEEFGVIPMTNEKFEFYKDGVFNIGTAGGQTKASSGYTFQFIQKQSEKIVDGLIQGRSLQTVPATPNTVFIFMILYFFAGRKEIRER